MLESKIEKDSVKAAKKLGWYSFKVLSQLNKGLPDKCYLGHGKVVFIEYKQPGKQPTALQAKVHQIFAERMLPPSLRLKQYNHHYLVARSCFASPEPCHQQYCLVLLA